MILAQYAESCWPLVGAELLSPTYYLHKWLLGGFGFNDRESSVLWNVPLNVLTQWANQNPEAVPHLLGMMAMFTVDDKGEPHWHPSALALFDCQFTQECARAVWSSLLSFGSIGSRVPYLELRIRLVRQIENHPKAKVREMAAALIAALDEESNREEKRDQELRVGILQ